MNQKVRILVIDDHPMTIKSYTIVLMNGIANYEIEIGSAYNCDQALALMNNGHEDFFDIVLLDIKLPGSVDGSIIDGEDLGLRIRKIFLKTKIIVHTSLNDQQHISNIFKLLNPEGFLIKSDIDEEVLLSAVRSVIKENTYYSERTNRLLFNQNDNIHLDSFDRKILYHLSVGEKMKDLPNLVHLSMATVERRKKNLKLIFGISDGTNKQLIDIAKKKGFI